MSQKIKYTSENFGPFLFKSSLPNEMIDELLTSGIECQESANHTLAGHLENQYLYPRTFQENFYKKFSPFLSAYREGHCNYHNLSHSVSVEMQAIDLWVNFMKPGDFNPLHTHGYDLSFVTFLSVPDEIFVENQNFKGIGAGPGNITFQYTHLAKPQWATTGKSYLPKKGDLFIFPALLQHWVAPFKSNVTRISVSGNIVVSNKKEFPAGYF